MDTDHQKQFKLVAEVSKTLNLLTEEKINQILKDLAKETANKMHYILSENLKDLKIMDANDPKYDRLLLNEERIQNIINDINNVINLPSPVGRILEEKTLPNGLHLTKQAFPFGVIGIIFEARPNVVFDVFSLTLKSGNASILKGGSDASYSNQAIVNIIQEVLDANAINPNICTLLPNDRESMEQLLQAKEYVDLIIPRGGKGLIEFVRENAKVPVIETGAGVCHTYIDKQADIALAQKVITNAKTRKVSVCNSLDCLIIHKDMLSELPTICKELATKNVTIYADKKAYAQLENNYPQNLLFPADDNYHFGLEFLDYKMSIKTVNDIDEALKHISTYSSKHSEAIISSIDNSLDKFTKLVDAACVYTNASTAFTDGSQFGLGAEIGISTQKMHARGPMALEELCTYKWIVRGNGQIRN